MKFTIKYKFTAYQKMRHQRSLYIQLLEYGKSKLSFTLNDLKNEFKLDSGEKLNSEQILTIIRQINDKMIFYTNGYTLSGSDDSFQNSIKLYFSVEDEFRLLDYVELMEARKASKQANYWAIGALLISIAGSAISIYFSNKQIESDVNIPKDFLNTINQIQNNLKATNQKLDILNQQVALLTENKHTDDTKKRGEE